MPPSLSTKRSAESRDFVQSRETSDSLFEKYWPIPRLRRFVFRPLETLLLALVAVLGGLGFSTVSAALHLRQGENPLATLPAPLLPPAVLVLSFLFLHL